MADTDFYIRGDDSRKYIPDMLEINDKVSRFITQIEMTLFTDKYQVLGEPNFGINLSDLLFTFEKNEAEIQDKILHQIYSYCSLSRTFDIYVEVLFKQTHVRDIGFINIYIQGQNMLTVLM